MNRQAGKLAVAVCAGLLASAAFAQSGGGAAGGSSGGAAPSATPIGAPGTAPSPNPNSNPNPNPNSSPINPNPELSPTSPNPGTSPINPNPTTINPNATNPSASGSANGQITPTTNGNLPTNPDNPKIPPTVGNPASVSAQTPVQGSVAMGNNNAAQIFSGLDRSQKGYLSQADVASNHFLAGNFQKCDTNGDGRLTQAEVSLCTQNMPPGEQ